MFFRRFLFLLLIFAFAAASLSAKEHSKFRQGRPLTPEQTALVSQAIAREKVTIKAIQLRAPIVETYIQDVRPDATYEEVPVKDDYLLSRVDFRKAFTDDLYARRQDSNRGFLAGSRDALAKIGHALDLDSKHYSPTGFMEMMFIDPTGFDEQHYAFSFVRREFLGSVRTAVFEVHPKTPSIGRFYGDIWVEDPGGNIVRFNGTYVSGQSGFSYKQFCHVDSWRENLQPDLWLPVAVYVEETHPVGNEGSAGLKAQTHFWGYSLKMPSGDSENVSIHVDDAVDESDNSQDVSPLQASQLWIDQAENNVIDRLVEAGLVAPLTPGGYEDKILGQIVINLEVPNKLAFMEPVHARVLLTDTLEATTVGNTILISKGLLDSLPSEQAIASVIAMELAHIAMGHHIDTRYAFSDRLLFPDEATFQRIDLGHSAADNAAAAKQAMVYLENSMYKNKLPDAGLYYEQLAARAPALKSLTTPTIGDSLLQPDGTPWMAALEKGSPKLQPGNASQIAALPLGSWLKTDPWTDTVSMLDAKRYAPMNAAEKLPFEVTPVYFRLQPYEAPQSQASATPGATEPASNSANQGDPPVAPTSSNTQAVAVPKTQ
jgi:Peptidase family M48